MRFLIAESYTKSLAALTQDEQNLAKQSIFDFQVDPSVPSLNFHRVHKSKDKNFWSFRVNDDIRTIVYKRGADLVICYIDHHDKAYRWTYNNQVKIHPTTGAAQFVKSEERIQEVIKQVEVSQGPAAFKRFEEDYLLALGVPPEWLQAVQQMTADEFVEFSPELPDEAAEHLMMLVEGQFVPTPTPLVDGDPFLHPDARRRFVVVGQDEHELHQALNYPLDAWMVFLHPKQQEPVQKDYRGAAKISGGAGTGKTVVALHRVAFLLRHNPEANVLLTTFSKALASRLEQALSQLLGDSPLRARVTVTHLHRLAVQLYQQPFTALDDATLRREITRAQRETGEEGFSVGFLMAEWQHVLDAYDISTFPAYRQVARVGRGTPLQVRQRMAVWTVLARVRERLEQDGQISFARLCHRVAAQLDASNPPFSHVVADETQDFGAAELRLLRSLAPANPNSLMLVGDNGQRIYSAQASLKASGIDVVGRSSILRLNYRTTEQIRRRADLLLPKELMDIDGDVETRTTVSLLRGPEPEVLAFVSVQQEIDAVASRLEYYLNSGFKPRDIALFARTNYLLEERVQAALAVCGYPGAQLSEDALPQDQVAIGTMHRAKGLEFKIVMVMACEAGVVPLAQALAGASDDAERKLVLEQERNLLYVAATRAREQLVISYTGVPSEFLGDAYS